MPKTRAKLILLRCTAVVISLFLAALLTEIALRLLGMGFGNAPLESDPTLHHRHPRSYRFVSHTPTGEYGGHIVYYDQHGCSADPKNPTPPTDTPFRIAFLGDSFTEAGQVAYADSFVGRLQQRTSSATLRNYGVSSYSPILCLLQWRKEVLHFKPTHVVLQLYSNDIDDDAKYAAMAMFSEGEPSAVPGPTGGWLVKLARKSYLARLVRKHYLALAWNAEHGKQEEQQVIGGLVEQDPELSDMSQNFVRSLAREVTESGAAFVLMVVPSKYRVSQGHGFSDSTPQFSDKWRAWARQHDITFLDLVAPFDQADKTLFFQRDIHFNEAGHAVAAQALANYFPEIFSAQKAAGIAFDPSASGN